jgi:glucose-1-phosphate cytidylyltransferase
MKIYSAHGINNFVICCGYKSYIIKEYFANYFLHTADITFDLRENRMEVHRASTEPWKVTLIETGDTTMTGGRIKRVREHIGDETFCMTYGDGVGNVDITGLVAYHRSQGALATLTAVQPPGRFGAFALGEEQARVSSFKEKPRGDGEGAYINGGYFVLEPQVFDYIDGDRTVWEKEPLERLAQDGHLAAYRHRGFWQPMDTLHDKNLLEDLWRSGSAPWKIWS